MRLCLAGVPAMEISIEEEMEAAERAGFSSLDLWSPKLSALLASDSVVLLDLRLRKRNLHVMALSSPGSILARAGADWALAQAQFLETCTQLDALGGGIIILSPGSISEHTTAERDRTASVVRRLQDLSGLAAPFEVRIAFEARGDIHSSVRSLSESQEIVARVGRANVGLALSTYQFFLSQGRVKELDRLDMDRLWLVHLGDGERPADESTAQEVRMLVGQGSAPVRQICERLARKGFRGPYSVQVPFGERPLSDTAVSARQAVIDLFASMELAEM